MFTLLLGLALLSTTQASPGRVVNGVNAEPGEFPYIVSVQYTDYKTLHVCAGTILNEYWILTAASCVRNKEASKYTIEYGVTSISCDGSHGVPIASYIVHDSYVPEKGYFNNIALIKLVQPLEFSESVQPVTLPPALDPTPEGAAAEIAGWGEVYTGSAIPTDLKRANLLISTDDECESTHALSGPTDRDYHICSGVVGGGTGQCTGDGGGPLLVNGVQVGIISWSGKPCTTSPGVSTKVSRYIDWINANIA